MEFIFVHTLYRIRTKLTECHWQMAAKFRRSKVKGQGHRSKYPSMRGNIPILMAARCVGQNSGPIFRNLWTKVNRIKSACAGVSVVCNAVFRLTMSCCVPEIFAIKSRSCAKSPGGRGHPNF